MAVVPRDTAVFANLHPHMVGPAKALQVAAAANPFTLNGSRYRFEPFEGFRNPARQNYLFAVSKTTKARPWQSAHQYGLAVDFACRRIVKDHAPGEGWYWLDDAPWGQLKSLARGEGLDIPIAWDKGHVEHPIWNKIKAYLV